MAKSDAEWEAESDAGTLINAEIIRKDDKKYKAAVKHIKKQNEASATAMKKR